MPIDSLNRAVAKFAFALALGTAAGAATAHDTWFRALRTARPGEVLLMLGTGNRFPVHESAVGAEHLVRSGCRSGTAGGTLAGVYLVPQALVLRGTVDRAAAPAPVTCWAQLVPFEVELTPDIAQIYLDEIAAPQAIRDAWTAMQSRGVRWKERYTKHARIEVGTAMPLPPAAVDMGMDVLLESGIGGDGDALVFRVLRDGRPLPDFAVELISERSDASWHRTDSEGRVRWRPPAPGIWVLRGTDLRLSETSPDTWESRFVTLAFEVAAARAGR